MQDTATELTYYPKVWLSLQDFDRALCVAPHPDDEVLSCGGALMLLAKQGAHVQSLILTSGDQALGNAEDDHPRTRQLESIAAAQVMGTNAPQFLDFPDRGLHYSELLVQAILQALQNLPISSKGQSALLFLPSLSEPHPDHQAAALAGMAAAQRWGQAVKVLFCEIGAPLQPNLYLDITDVAEQKAQAMSQFKSQLGLENYAQLNTVMGTLRAFGKGPECHAAEAYFQVDMDALRKEGPLAALPQWPWARRRLNLANAPQDLPLVSILIRSMDRPSLAETLASVAQQNYPNIEVVLVNASGRPHSSVHYLPEHLSLKLIQPEGLMPLGRSVAANEALMNCQGSLALFLDDDDLIEPDHLQRLVQALHQKKNAVAAYSGVRVVDADGQTLRNYDIPWHRERLQAINFLPIHAVLFRMHVVRERQLRFDPSLPVLEDWDFWRQLGQVESFIHSPGITATYRQSLGQSSLGEPGHDNNWQSWHLQLLQKYLSHAPKQETAKCLAWHAIELDKAEHRIAQVQQQQTEALQQLNQQFSTLSDQMHSQLQAKEAQIQAFSAESSQALANKEQALHQLAEQTQQALDAKESALQTLHSQLQQLNSELENTKNQLGQLQIWARKITRWLPAFLHHPQDKQ